MCGMMSVGWVILRSILPGYSKWSDIGHEFEHAVLFDQGRGGRTVLERGAVPVPSPGAGQVLVRVHAAGLNRGSSSRRAACTPGAPGRRGPRGG